MLSEQSNDEPAVKDNNQWTEIQRKRTRAPINVVKGTAAPGKTILEASERIKYYHLYYVKQGTTDQMICDHLRSIFSKKVGSVETLQSKGPYASFKIGVPSKLSDQLLAVDNWAEDICIKPWRNNFRGNTKESKQ